MPRSGRAPPAATTSSSAQGALAPAPSFINKPPRGWLHPDTQIATTGISYRVRYIGCLKVKTSMKSLDFDTRSQIAKECINRVCEYANLKTVDKKKKIDRRLAGMLADTPNMEFAGANVNLRITSSFLNLTVMESGEVIANHEMPNISFASGGDTDTLDYVAYVAKDQLNGRACFVLECGGSLAQEVITTIGQAFELRFREFLKRTPHAVGLPERSENCMFNGHHNPAGDDPEYYNDLPGKMPPEAPVPPVPPLPDYNTENEQPQQSGETVYTAIKEAHPARSSSTTPSQVPVPSSRKVSREASGNLIDLNMDVHPPSGKTEPEYVNTSTSSAHNGGVTTSDSAGATGTSSNTVTAGASSAKTNKSSLDAFDMHPFHSSVPSQSNVSPPPPPRHQDRQTPTPAASASSSTHSSTPPPSVAGPSQNKSATSASLQKAALALEEWFHGPINRKDSEALVVKDGDFLVRESQGSPGQYVLTGMQGGTRKHLLLVDPEGVVRTKDRTFESVSHLINYHRDNGLPIISAESALVLKNAVPRPRPVR